MIEPGHQIQLRAPETEPRSAILEAMLFAAGEPVEIRDLMNVLQWSLEETRQAIDELENELAGAGRGLALQRHAESVQLVSAPRFGLMIHRLLIRERTVRLSSAALETLAIIAYQQPVTRAEIESLRGVDSSGVLQTLIARELVERPGRRAAPGNPHEYVTTTAFLRHFGIRSLEDLGG